MTLDVLHINTVGSPRSSVGSVICGIMSGIDLLCQETGHPKPRVGIAAGYGELPARCDASMVMESGYMRAVNAFKARCNDDDGFQGTSSTRRLVTFMLEHRPRVVHIHNLHGYYMDLAVLSETLKELAVPVVLTLHDRWLFTGHCASVPTDCMGFERQCVRCAHKSVYPRAWRTGDTASHRQAKLDFLKGLRRKVVIAPSRGMATVAREALGDGADIRIIPHGVNGVFFDVGTKRHESVNGTDRHESVNGNYGQRVQCHARPLKLLAVARQWSEVKNLRALLALAQDMPETWQMTIVGRTSEKFPGNVRHIPVVDTPESMALLYKASDVTLSASHSESFGLTVAESITAGTPVVVNVNSDAADLLLQPSDGVTADFDDIPAVIEAVRKASALDPVSSFPISEMARRYYELYDILLEE